MSIVNSNKRENHDITINGRPHRAAIILDMGYFEVSRFILALRTGRSSPRLIRKWLLVWLLVKAAFHDRNICQSECSYFKPRSRGRLRSPPPPHPALEHTQETKLLSQVHSTQQHHPVKKIFTRALEDYLQTIAVALGHFSLP